MRSTSKPPQLPTTHSYELVPNRSGGHLAQLLEQINNLEARRQHAHSAGEAWRPIGDDALWERLADILEELHTAPMVRGVDRFADLVRGLNGSHADVTGLIAHPFEVKLERTGWPYRFRIVARPQGATASLLAFFALDVLAGERWRSIRRCKRAACRQWFFAPTKRREFCADACRLAEFEKRARDKKIQVVLDRQHRREQRHLQPAIKPAPAGR